MENLTIDGKKYYPVTAPSGDKRFCLVGPDCAIYRFETEARRWDFVDTLRSQLEGARAQVVPVTGLGRSAADIRALKATRDHKSFGERFESRYHNSTEEK